MSEAMKGDVLEDWLETRTTIYIGIAGFTILVWDHLVTSGDEIELIWKGSKGILVYLFLLNRYLTPLGFIINLVAYNLPTWSVTRSALHCATLTSADVVQVASILFAWIGVTAWLLSYGEPVIHSDGVRSCTMVFTSGSLASASAWLPLIYDTYIFGLTLYRTFPSVRNKEAGKIVRTLFADGLLYYSVICTVNLVLTIMIIRAPVGLRNIVAQLELLLTVTMMSRITLNLRKQASNKPNPDHLQLDSIIMSRRNGISTASEGVVVGRVRSHSASSARISSSRMRSDSASSITPPVRSIIFAENPSHSIPRARLSTILSANNSPAMSSVSGSPVSDHASWFSNQQNTTDVV
ncbi:hypothetical protein K503DRAFT_798560 [Rhizopogon vinicolor AM-OR11-026]|uniref:DUF6533 domain-containing protein n=1 Tax=Rhizopogon vinicolor AM-OR11-026 TaxID=1314800 RepID=A0A1B7N781_9AGAM|nr:hypothetical protein K503DRAFT_798560 [Rhizopogon vinicolor AM-OR11-026]